MMQKGAPVWVMNEIRQLLSLLYRGYELRGAPGGASWLPHVASRDGGDADMSPRVTTREGKLLRVLFKETPSDASVMEHDCEVMLSLIQSWPGAGGGVAPSGTPSENIGCVLQMARHCARYVKGWLVGMQRERRRSGQGGPRGSLAPKLAMDQKNVMTKVQRVVRMVCMHAAVYELPGGAGERVCVHDILKIVPVSLRLLFVVEFVGSHGLMYQLL